MILNIVSRFDRITLGRWLHVSGGIVVTTNGCFDLFHCGHAAFLRRCAAMGDALIVLVNTDTSVSRIKAGRPILPWKERAECVAAIDGVSLVLPLPETDPCAALTDLRPHVHVKDATYRRKAMPERDVVRCNGGRVAYVQRIGVVSTSYIVRKVAAMQGRGL